MRRVLGIGILVVLGLAAFLSLWGTPVSWLDVIQQPWMSLWSSHQQFQVELLKVSENIEPLGAAGRPLSEPRGGIEMLHAYPPADSPDAKKH